MSTARSGASFRDAGAIRLRIPCTRIARVSMSLRRLRARFREVIRGVSARNDGDRCHGCQFARRTDASRERRVSPAVAAGVCEHRRIVSGHRPSQARGLERGRVDQAQDGAATDRRTGGDGPTSRRYADRRIVFRQPGRGACADLRQSRLSLHLRDRSQYFAPGDPGDAGRGRPDRACGAARCTGRLPRHTYRLDPRDRGARCAMGVAQPIRESGKLARALPVDSARDLCSAAPRRSSVRGCGDHRHIDGVLAIRARASSGHARRGCRRDRFCHVRRFAGAEAHSRAGGKLPSGAEGGAECRTAGRHRPCRRAGHATHVPCPCAARVDRGRIDRQRAACRANVGCRYCRRRRGCGTRARHGRQVSRNGVRPRLGRVMYRWQ